MYFVFVQQEAVEAIIDACNWYDERMLGLGEKLSLEINKCLEKLSKQPENYTFINNTYRRIRTDRFPYFLIYEIENNTVIINDFRHAKRKRKRHD